MPQSPVHNVRRRTLEVSALLLPEPCARLLHSGGERNLDVLRHDFVCLGQGTSTLLLSDHLLDTLNTSVAVVEALGNILCQTLDLPLLGPLGVLIVEAREYVLLVQPLQFLALACYIGQQICHLICNVGPAWREQVHFDHSITVIVVVGRAGGEQAAAVVIGVEEHGAAGSVAEAVSRGQVCTAAIFITMSRMMCVGLSVGEVAVRRG